MSTPNRTNRLTRQVHRWLSIVFTIAVLINLGAMVVLDAEQQQQLGPVIGSLAAVPLIPMLLTGLYLFVLPYRAGSRQ